VHGDARGRTIGFPTANTYVWEGQIIPANGVYACWASLGDERFMAVTNVGNRPTFDGKSVTVEAHLLDFERDIYGQPLSLEFVQRLRGEQKFDGVAALVAQIGQDAQQGRAILMAP
jgi:riboflavin kinase/FMN adenylyltransferase